MSWTTVMFLFYTYKVIVSRQHACDDSEACHSCRLHDISAPSRTQCLALSAIRDRYHRFYLSQLPRPLQGSDLTAREIYPHGRPSVHYYEPDSNVSQWYMTRVHLYHTIVGVHSPQSQCDIAMITLPQRSWRHCLQPSISCRPSIIFIKLKFLLNPKMLPNM